MSDDRLKMGCNAGDFAPFGTMPLPPSPIMPVGCPFCGAVPAVDQFNDDGLFQAIRCETLACPAGAGAMYLSRDRAVERWNKRVSPAAVAQDGPPNPVPPAVPAALVVKGIYSAKTMRAILFHDIERATRHSLANGGLVIPGDRCTWEV